MSFARMLLACGVIVVAILNLTLAGETSGMIK